MASGPRKKKALTDTAVRKAKPQAKPYKLVDGEGLYLYVSPSGAKVWRYDYRFMGMRQTLVIGSLDGWTLAEAREAHGEARKILERGGNPSAVKKQERAVEKNAARNTFKAWAEQWQKELAPKRSKAWRIVVTGWLKNWIYPQFGEKPLDAIKATDVLALMHKVRNDGKARTAELVRWQVSRVFDYAIRNLATEFNPAHTVKGAVQTPRVESHRPLSARELPVFLAAVSEETGRPDTQRAIELLVHTFVRKAELIEATWDEIDLDAAEWRIPKQRMKQREAHVVPLSTQVVAMFKRLAKDRIASKYVFHNQADPKKPMSAYTLNVAFGRMRDDIRAAIAKAEAEKGKFRPESKLESAAMRIKSFENFVPHGVRATASTLLNERGYRPDVIERQLAHTERNRVRATYNRADYLDERRKMMQDWSDYLDGLTQSPNISNIGEARKTA